jgi:signal transduction histidine kinase
MDSGRWKLDLQPVELASLARATVKRLEHTAGQNGCEVSFEASGEIHGMWDPLRLEQALATLLANAFKHGAGKAVDVSVTREGSRAVLKIGDHGAGIDAEAQPRVFERTPSTALGLWVTREIVQAHQGSITLQTAPGEGTCFIITLPMEGA